MRIDMRRTTELGWRIPRVSQTAAADPVGISDIVATINRRLQGCAGVAVVVQYCVATDFVVVVDGGNESTAMAARRFSRDRGAEARRKEVVLYTMY
jgi:hypothetical protein